MLFAQRRIIKARRKFGAFSQKSPLTLDSDAEPHRQMGRPENAEIGARLTSNAQIIDDEAGASKPDLQSHSFPQRADNHTASRANSPESRTVRNPQTESENLTDSISPQPCCNVAQMVEDANENIFWESFSKTQRIMSNAFPREWIMNIPDWLAGDYFEGRVAAYSGAILPNGVDTFTQKISKAFITPSLREKAGMQDAAFNSHQLLADYSVWLFLYHSIRNKDRALIEAFSQPPIWMRALETFPDITIKTAILDPSWLRFLLNHGGLQIALDLDSGDVSVFRSILKSVTKYIHVLKELHLPSNLLASSHFDSEMGSTGPSIRTHHGSFDILRSGADLWSQFLCIVAAVPEFASEERIGCAVDSLRILKRLHNDQKRQVFCEGKEATRPLEVTLRTLRRQVISGLLECFPQLLRNIVTCHGPLLHCFVRIVADDTEKYPPFKYIHDLGDTVNCDKLVVPICFSAGFFGWRFAVQKRESAASNSLDDIGIRKDNIVELFGVLHLERQFMIPADLTIVVDVTFELDKKQIKFYKLIYSQGKMESERFPVPASTRVIAEFQIKFASFGCRKIRDPEERKEEVFQIARDLIKQGVDVNIVYDGHTAWSLSLCRNVPKEIQLLIVPSNVQVAMELALHRKPLNWTEIGALIELCPPDVKFKKLNLSCCIGHKDTNKLQRVINFCCSQGITVSEWKKCVIIAVEHKDWESVETLLNFAPQGVNNLGNLCLCNFVLCGQTQLLKEFISLGADVNNGTRNEATTALHIAAERGDLEMAALLLDQGADCNIRQKGSGFTALHLACKNATEGDESYAEVVSLLLRFGADSKALSSRRQEPFHLTRSKRIRSLLGKNAASSFGMKGYAKKIEQIRHNCNDQVDSINYSMKDLCKSIGTNGSRWSHSASKPPDAQPVQVKNHGERVAVVAMLIENLSSRAGVSGKEKEILVESASSCEKQSHSQNVANRAVKLETEERQADHQTEPAPCIPCDSSTFPIEGSIAREPSPKDPSDRKSVV